MSIGTQRSLQQYKAMLQKIGVTFPHHGAGDDFTTNTRTNIAAPKEVGGCSGGCGGTCGSVAVDDLALLRLACGVKVRGCAEEPAVTYRFARTSVAGLGSPSSGPPPARLLDLRALQSIQAFL